MLFTLLPGGLYETTNLKTISLEELQALICNNPNIHEISKLYALVRGTKEYNKIKLPLPCIKVHATYHRQAEDNNLTGFTGFLYFDIDKGDCSETLKRLLEKHGDIICMAGRSVGGKGLFFYVRLENPELLTINNFVKVWNYFKDSVFVGFDLDISARTINRSHVIPSDPNLYINPNAQIYISPDIVKQNAEKGIKGYINRTKIVRYTTNDTFLIDPEYVVPTNQEILDIDIRLINKHIVWSTDVSKLIGDQKSVIGDFQIAKLFIPKKGIKDGSKHKTFRCMVHQIVFNNPGIEYKYILSFINFINNQYTQDKPMKVGEMKNTVKAAYTELKRTGQFYSINEKHVLTNPELPSGVRQAEGARAFGEYRKSKSIDQIKAVIEQLQAEGIKPTQKLVFNRLSGAISEPTIKRHWRTVLPKKAPAIKPKLKELKIQLEGQKIVVAA